MNASDAYHEGYGLPPVRRRYWAMASNHDIATIYWFRAGILAKAVATAYGVDLSEPVEGRRSPDPGPMSEAMPDWWWE